MNSTRRKTWLWWWMTAYVALAALIVGSMFWVRHTVLTEFSTDEAVADWRTWQADVREQQTNPGPVARRIPRSDEPPALVLMRDYFTVSLFGATFFTSLLYWVMAWFVTGALSANTPRD
jgi:hypothetical protein